MASLKVEVKCRVGKCDGLRVQLQTTNAENVQLGKKIQSLDTIPTPWK